VRVDRQGLVRFGFLDANSTPPTRLNAVHPSLSAFSVLVKALDGGSDAPADARVSAPAVRLVRASLVCSLLTAVGSLVCFLLLAVSAGA
jgi:hypothetical protein